MNEPDRKDFNAVLSSYLDDIYGKPVTAALEHIWFSCLQRYDLGDICEAFQHYVADPKGAQFPPKPGDIIGYLQATVSDRHPSADAAWGVVLRLVQNEDETGFLTEQMRAAWEACSPTLKARDMVGARLCFARVYDEMVFEARQKGIEPRWTPCLGHCPKIREMRLQEAVKAGQLTQEQACNLLPYLKPAHKQEPIAGLLEGPKDEVAAQRGRKRFEEVLAKLAAEAGAYRRQRQQAVEQEQLGYKARAKARFDALCAKYPEHEAELRKIQNGEPPDPVPEDAPLEHFIKNPSPRFAAEVLLIQEMQKDQVPEFGKSFTRPEKEA
jgi:hypothetical protein